MGVIGTIIIAILVFGFLIFIHEFGHYIFARIFKVTITEFSIGMGPKLLWYDSKKTKIRYALSAIPFGGYVAMVGEDGESDDPNAFHKKPCWQRLIITVAGAFINILAGVISIVILTSFINIGGTTIADFPIGEYYDDLEVRSDESGLMPGDTIFSVDGKRVKIADELSYEIMRKGTAPVDVVVVRDGRKLMIRDVVFPTTEEQGQNFGVMDFRVYRMEKNFGTVVNYALSRSALIVRMCWESIIDLMTGRYTLAAVSGPVGISEVIGSAARQGAISLLSIVGLISMNLGVMNLLPLPALDGGRIVMILYEMITRKKIPAKIESSINAIGLLLLLGLSAVVMIKDIFVLFT